MDPFWGESIAAALGALVGGGVSAVIAWRVFASERRARGAELAADAQRRQVEAAAAAVATRQARDEDREIRRIERLEDRRSTVIASLLEALANFAAAISVRDRGQVSEYQARCRTAWGRVVGVVEEADKEELLRWYLSVLEPVMAGSVGGGEDRVRSRNLLDRSMTELEGIIVGRSTWRDLSKVGE